MDKHVFRGVAVSETGVKVLNTGTPVLTSTLLGSVVATLVADQAEHGDGDPINKLPKLIGRTVFHQGARYPVWNA